MTGPVQPHGELAARDPQQGPAAVGDAEIEAAIEQLLGAAGTDGPAGLGAGARRVTLSAGERLFRQGDPADAAYVVVSGRLRVFVAAGDHVRRLGDVGRGETVGELALLADAPRSATVVAARDTELVAIATADFDALIRQRPEAGVRLSRLLAERLRRVTERDDVGPVARVVVSVLPAGETSTAEMFGLELAIALASLLGLPEPPIVGPREAGSATRRDLDAGMDAHEDAAGVVVYLGEPGWTAWNDRITARADEIVLVADADADPAPGTSDAGVAAAMGRSGARATLVLRHGPGRQPSGTAAWLDPRPGMAHLHVRTGEPAKAARVARWVTGRSTALVLGGGGARGWAHIGAARALREVGIPVDLVGGTSIGALVGAAVADDMPVDEMRRRSDGHIDHAVDVTLPLLSLIRGREIARGLRKVAREGTTIEDLWRPMFIVATNLTRAEPLVLDRGPLVEAIRASVALPGILPPVGRDGDLIVDGGVLDNLPIATMRRRMGRGRIIAVDVSPGIDLGRYDTIEPDVSGWRLLWERVRHRGRRRRVPSIVDVIQRTVVAGSVHLRRLGRDVSPDDLVLEPDLARWALLDFAARDAVAEAGYRAMIGPLRAWWTERGAATVPATEAPPAGGSVIETDTLRVDPTAPRA